MQRRKREQELTRRGACFPETFFSNVNFFHSLTRIEIGKKKGGGVVIDAQNLLAVDVPSRKFAKSVKKKEFV